MLKQKSVVQILEVLRLAKTSYGAGIPVQKACQEAVRTIAKKHGVEYQTIHDGCCRRLGLKRINEFYVLVQRWLTGDPSKLKNLLLKQADSTGHAEISSFFNERGRGKPKVQNINAGKSEDTMETFLVDLTKTEATMLKVLSEVTGSPPSQLIHESVMMNVKQQLKPLLQEYIDKHDQN